MQQNRCVLDLRGTLVRRRKYEVKSHEIQTIVFHRWDFSSSFIPGRRLRSGGLLWLLLGVCCLCSLLLRGCGHSTCGVRSRGVLRASRGSATRCRRARSITLQFSMRLKIGIDDPFLNSLFFSKHQNPSFCNMPQKLLTSTCIYKFLSRIDFSVHTRLNSLFMRIFLV